MRTHDLTNVSSPELERLLKALHRHTLDSPITRSNLIACAFGHIEEHLGALVGLDHIAAQRVIVAVLAERRPRVVR